LVGIGGNSVNGRSRRRKGWFGPDGSKSVVDVCRRKILVSIFKVVE